MNIVIGEVSRQDPTLVKGFEGIPTGVVSDAMDRCNSMAAEITPVWKGAKLVGLALTVRTFPADNLMLHKAATLAKPGDVLMVNAGGDRDRAVFGDLMAYSLKEQQVRQRIARGESLFDMQHPGEVLKSLGIAER